jgi:hypothetical protein
MDHVLIGPAGYGSFRVRGAYKRTVDEEHIPALRRRIFFYLQASSAGYAIHDTSRAIFLRLTCHSGRDNVVMYQMYSISCGLMEFLSTKGDISRCLTQHVGLLGNNVRAFISGRRASMAQSSYLGYITWW